MLPDVATLAEQGFADTDAETGTGCWRRPRLRPPWSRNCNDAVVAALKAPDIREKLVQSGAVPAPTSSAEFGELLSDEHARWGRVVREKGIKEE